LVPQHPFLGDMRWIDGGVFGDGGADDVAEKTFACMKQAYDCGINFFDTAER
jgi:aryl-alcohol dehydrogenase-like predicted oxidoreductase